MLKKTFFFIIKLIVTLAVIFWIINKYGWNEIISSLSSANVYYLAAGIFLFVISVFIGALQWKILLDNKGIKIPYSKAVTIYYTGIFFNNFILGMIAGDGFKVTALHLAKRDVKKSFAATFLDRFAGLFMLSVFSVFGGIYVILFSNVKSTPRLELVFFSLFLFSFFLFFFLIILFSRRIQNLLIKFLDYLPYFSFKEKIREIFYALFIDRRGNEDRIMLFKITATSFLIQFLRIFVHILSALSLGVFKPEFAPYFFIVIPVIALMMLIPMPFGIRESVGGIIFGYLGIPVKKALIMEFLATICGIAGSLVGVYFFLTHKNDW